MVTFGITCRVVNKVNTEDINLCIESIKKFHPDARIIVVDSDSPDKSYMSSLRQQGVIVEDIKNKNYETGTIWHLYENYPSDKYIFLQDSMRLTASLKEFLGKDFTAINYYPGWKHIKPQEKDWCKQQLAKTDYTFKEDNNFNMVQYNSFIVAHSVLNLLESKNLRTVLPTEKAHSQAMERVFGIALTEEGLTTDQLIGPKINKIWRMRK